MAKRNPYDSPGQRLADAVEEEKARRQHEIAVALSEADTGQMIAVLYERGVTVRDIFAQYYEMEEADNAPRMTVEDAELAGFGEDNLKPLEGF